MISITVASYNGAQMAQPLVGHFDEMGGNIGRADNNQLVLPDPERTISRVHAQIVFRSGRYAIVDRGSNPISINGRPLGNGQESMLQPGDEIAIGGYVMRVEAPGAGHGAAPVDPFADFAGLASNSGAGPGRAAAPAPHGYTDPLAGFGIASNPPPAYAPPPYAAPPAYAPAAAAPAAGGIPADWDPFAPESAAKPRADDFARSLGQPAGGAGNFGLEIGGRAAPLIPELSGSGSGGVDSIDNLFGLAPGGSGDPLAGSLLSAAAAQPNMAANADPMKSLNSITKGSGQAAADSMPELQSPFMLPPMKVAPAARAAAAPASPPTAPVASVPAARNVVSQRMAPQAAPPQGAVLSWDDPSGESRTVIRPRAAPLAPISPAAPTAPVGDPLDLALDPGARAPLPGAVTPMQTWPPASQSVAAPHTSAQHAAVGQPSASSRAAVAPPPAQPAAPRPALPASAAASAAGGADMQALVAALREGLNVEGLSADALALTPQLMRLLGQLVHEATRGTVDLLVARAALKREIRAEVTMIVARENNPLKFSPSVDVALNHLLSPPARGFMAPDRAMRDAYDDLRAHQFGFLAGMRAALEGVLKRFDPAVLESKLTQKSVLSSLLPASRKARMWDVFRDLYSQISSEASDDFHELFGKEFLRAYEEYIDQLAKDRP
ncbi:MAG: type VI secretion system-associated FHA domain protein TagH [Caldimonas sp.]